MNAQWPGNGIETACCRPRWRTCRRRLCWRFYIWRLVENRDHDPHPTSPKYPQRARSIWGRWCLTQAINHVLDFITHETVVDCIGGYHGGVHDVEGEGFELLHGFDFAHAIDHVTVAQFVGGEIVETQMIT